MENEIFWNKKKPVEIKKVDRWTIKEESDNFILLIFDDCRGPLDVFEELLSMGLTVSVFEINPMNGYKLNFVCLKLPAFKGIINPE